jgi:hypothetical protein
MSGRGREGRVDISIRWRRWRWSRSSDAEGDDVVEEGEGAWIADRRESMQNWGRTSESASTEEDDEVA